MARFPSLTIYFKVYLEEESICIQIGVVVKSIRKEKDEIMFKVAGKLLFYIILTPTPTPQVCFYTSSALDRRIGGDSAKTILNPYVFKNIISINITIVYKVIFSF